MTELEYDLEKALEKLNLQYIELSRDPDYRFGKNIRQLFNRMKALDFKYFCNYFINRKKIKNLSCKNSNKDNLSDSEWTNNLIHIESDKKIAVYTCIVGNYDKLHDPLLVNKNFEYFVFTDSCIDSNIWKKKEIPSNIMDLSNNTLINRWLKMHPYKLFPEYDYTLYIDGNVTIISDLTSILHCADNDYGIAMHNHVLRDCIYEEANACIIHGKGNKQKLRQQCIKYREEGYPEHNGMLEATIILSNIHNNKVDKVFDNWWNEFINSESKRDQISLPYVLWKMNIETKAIGLLGNNVYRNPKFFIISH